MLRRLLHDRLFAAMAILTLGLGIGANTAIFSLISAVLLQPLPYADPGRVVLIWNTAAMGDMTWLSAEEVRAYRNAAPDLDLAAQYVTDGAFTGGQEPERVRVALVTPNMLDVLGVAPAVGRAFTAADGTAGNDDGVILGDGLWRRRFGGEPDVIGRRIEVNGRTRTVLGVMPPGFRLPLDYRDDRPTEAWMPLVLDNPALGGWGNRQFVAVGRLREGATTETATAQLHAASAGWIAAGFVVDQGDGRFTDRAAIPAGDMLTHDARRPLYLLLATVVAVMLVAIANVASLLLARADARGQEMAVRAALGAGRARLVRQMLGESLVLAGAGAVTGVALAWTALRALRALGPSTLPRAVDASIDAGALAFTAGLTIVTGLIFGSVPAARFSGARLMTTLRDGTRGGTPGRAKRLARRALVASQVAMSVILVLAAGVFAQSLIAMTRIDTGFESGRVLTAQVPLPAASYRTAAETVAFYRALVERLNASPGVERAGAVRILPLTRTIGDWSIMLEGRPYDPRENPNGDWQIATPGYFEAVGMTVSEGRPILDSDREDALPVVVINETMAARYWPGELAIGKRFRLGTSEQPWVTIVGIVRDVRHNALLEEQRAEMYVPHAQWWVATGGTARSMAVAIRTTGDPMAHAGTLRAAVRALDPNLPISDVQAFDAVVGRALAEPRFTAGLLAAFGVLALVLAAVGIYGTVSLLVTEQSREIGIRMALGAARGAVMRSVLGQGLTMASLGIFAGVLLAAALLPLAGALLYGITPLDPGTLTGVCLLLLAVAVAGSLAPAARASRIDPAGLLRR